MRKYIEIGETAEIDGVKIKCVEDIEQGYSCDKCAMYNDESCMKVLCYSENRIDNKDVYFTILTNPKPSEEININLESDYTCLEF